MDFDFLTSNRKEKERSRAEKRDAFNSIHTMYQLTPEAEERFNRSFLQNTRGTVRVNPGAYGFSLLIFAILGTLLATVGYRLPDMIKALVAIVYFLGVFISFWSRFTWKIDFDGASGFVHYHTLFGGTKTYHVTDLMAFETHIRSLTNDSAVLMSKANSYSYRRGFFRGVSYLQHKTFLTTDTLEIMTQDGIIMVPLATSWNSSRISRGIGGYMGADKFYTYLDMYRRHQLMRDEPANTADMGDGLSYGVREAINAQKNAVQEPLPTELPPLTEDDYNPTGLIHTSHDDIPDGAVPDISVPVTGIPDTHIGAKRLDQTGSSPAEPVTAAEPAAPAPKPVKAEKPAIPAITDPLPDPAAARAAMPQRSNTDFPDPTRSAFPDPTKSAFPDPAISAFPEPAKAEPKPTAKSDAKPAPKSAVKSEPKNTPAPKPVNPPKPEVKPVQPETKPAPKPNTNQTAKSPEEIDEMFNNVLRQHGKVPHASHDGRTSLFGSVFGQKK